MFGGLKWEDKDLRLHVVLRAVTAYTHTFQTMCVMEPVCEVSYLSLCCLSRMSGSICLYDRSMAQRLDPQFPERSPKGPLVNACFQKGRNNNPLCDVFHMRSATPGTVSFVFLRSKKRRREKPKDKSKKKVSGREEKVRKDIKFQFNLGSRTNG